MQTNKKNMFGLSQLQLFFYCWSKLDALGKANIKIKYVGKQYLSVKEKMALRSSVAFSNQLGNQQWGIF